MRGRPRFNPTTKQRQRISRGIAVGLTLEQLALDIDVPMGTMRRAFATEIKTGRVKTILDNLDRLHKAADRGNVSAMRALQRAMMQPVQPTVEDEDQWADVVGDQSFLSRNADLH